MELDTILLARIQFAFTVSFHIIFPAISIGLASFLAIVEWRWLSTGNELFRDIYKFWVKIFAVTFGMGVVSGVVMSYEFGTNWSVFSHKISNVLGPLLGFEVLTAFFLEASFLGIMIFGWGRVSKNMHFFSTSIVAIGTLISAFWILSANSWMQTPQGFSIGEDGRLIPTNWVEIIFNPSFIYRFVHMTTAAYLTTSFFIGGVAALFLLRNKYEKHARVMLGMAVMMAALVSPMQAFIGHMHGENTMHYQPAKVAAMEGNWEHRENAPLLLFAIPDQPTESNKYSIEIPGGASWILTGDTTGKIPALKDFAKEDLPPVIWVFWSFRIMVGLGILMIAIGIMSTIAYLRGRLFNSTWLHIWWVWMIPSGFIALLAGWFVTEIGRQPWTAYGVIRTAESVSPAITGPQVAWSLAIFVIAYSFIFSAGIYYIVKLINHGISLDKEPGGYYEHSLEASAIKAITPKGGKNV